MITYPIPLDKRKKPLWSVYDPTAQPEDAFLSKNQHWPDDDGNEVPLPEPLVWLEKIPAIEPIVDSRYRQIVPQSVIDVANEELRTEYTTPKHTAGTLKREVRNRAASEQDKHLNNETLLTQIPIILGLLIQKTDLQEIPQEKRKELKKFLKRATQVIDNDTIVQQLEADVDAGLDIDLDGAPWADPLTEEELNAE